MNEWLVLAVYLVGLPVMFKITGYWMWRTMDSIGSPSWSGPEWFMIIFFTIGWPFGAICLGMIVAIDWFSDRHSKSPKVRALIRWTAPKDIRKRLDSSDGD